jgi:hypothetical protein
MIRVALNNFNDKLTDLKENDGVNMSSINQ